MTGDDLVRDVVATMKEADARLIELYVENAALKLEVEELKRQLKSPPY